MILSLLHTVHPLPDLVVRRVVEDEAKAPLTVVATLEGHPQSLLRPSPRRVAR
jgi:hypothetical protein